MEPDVDANIRQWNSSFNKMPVKGKSWIVHVGIHELMPHNTQHANINTTIAFTAVSVLVFKIIDLKYFMLFCVVP
jgi:hypothetical protein